MRKTLFISFVLLPMLLLLQAGKSLPPRQSYYELRIYHAASREQETIVDNFLKRALLPALHRNAIRTVGVFKASGIDTAADKKIYVLIPYTSLEQFASIGKKLEKDKAFQKEGNEYLNAVYNKPAYSRMETILLRAFEDAPTLEMPKLTGPRAQRIYELRSYEGASEKIFQNKVQMFNKGDEIGLFKRLGFNAVFYGEVLSGSRMPNLMYMTTFNNMQERNEHWKAFGSDSVWKKLSSMPEYQHNVSKIDIFYLVPTEYSDF